MRIHRSQSDEGRSSRPVFLSPGSTVLLAIAFGLCAGYLDLGIMLFKKIFLHSEGYVRSARDFAWTVPLGHMILVGTVGVVLAAVNGLRPGGISLRVASWLFATLAIWGPFLRMPMYIGCTLLLAVGMGRLVSDAIVARGMTPRRLRQVLGGLFGVLGILAAATTGRQAVLEYYTVANLSLPLAKVRNVVLIVWDTVRAQNSSLYGYPRDTTPNLTRWAQRGVAFHDAIAPRRGRIRRILAFLPAAGLSSSIPNGSSSSMPKFQPWRSIWPARGTRRQGSLPTPTVAVMKGGWIEALPITKTMR